LKQLRRRAEAIYADRERFGRRLIRIAWYGFALVALLLSYIWKREAQLNEKMLASLGRHGNDPTIWDGVALNISKK